MNMLVWSSSREVIKKKEYQVSRWNSKLSFQLRQAFQWLIQADFAAPAKRIGKDLQAKASSPLPLIEKSTLAMVDPSFTLVPKEMPGIQEEEKDDVLLIWQRCHNI